MRCKRTPFVSLSGWGALLGAVALSTSLQAAPPAAPGPQAANAARRSAKVQDFGVRGFRRDFFGTLTVTPFACDRTLPEGAGHSRVTYTGADEPFDPAWVNDKVEFVAYRIHKNPVEVTADCFFPAVLGSRYARVMRVVDGRNLIVNFEYNGGAPAAPKVSERASGYFFIDCAPALRKMVSAPDRPDVFLFESGQCYVCKGMPNVPFLAKEQGRDMRWTSTDPGARATIKLSAEDAIAAPARGAAPAIPAGAFFRLDTHDHSIFLDNLDIVGPTYMVPAVEAGWDGVMFAYTNGQCARTLEIRNCNTFAEKMECERRSAALPPGATWVAPDITGIVGGGGKRGDRGDGVMDMLAWQRFNLVRSTWVALEIHSIKNNDGAGNWILIDGVDLDKDGVPLNMAYEAMYAKRNRFSGVSLSFHNFGGAGARRGVRAESPDFSWRMLTNQYWTGGTSTSSTEPSLIEIDGFTLYFGNNGDWRRESEAKGSGGYRNAAEAVLFDRIPVPGDKVPLEKIANGAWRVWGWGVQKGDVLSVNGRDLEIAGRKRLTTAGPVLGVAASGKAAGYAHYWEITFKGGAGPEGDRPVAEVKKSATAYLLDGRPRKADVVYNRDLHGHWQYNRAEVNYQFRNICFNGYYRQTAGPAVDKSGEYQGLWELPVTQEWVNCWAMKTDGTARGAPADQIGSEAFNKTVLTLRNAHPQSKTRDHHVLVDGGHLFAQRLNTGISPLWIRNRPTLIYGTASFGEPRICNPVMLDDKGVVCPAGLGLSLVGGCAVDLSHSVIGSPNGKSPQNLAVYGNGSVTLNDARLPEVVVGKQTHAGAVVTALANGLQKDRFALHIEGRGGSSGFKLKGTPEDGSVKLTNWTLKMPMFSRSRFAVSDGWKALPGFRDKVIVNGQPGDAVKP